MSPEAPDPIRGVNAIGKAVELYIAAYCILASNGKLNVSTSYIDDEGVDLVFNRWGRSTTLAIQVKSRTTEAGVIKNRTFIADLKRSTFQSRPDYYVLFTVIDRPAARLQSMWLVPSAALEGRNPGKKKIRFQTNVTPSGSGQWDPYFITPPDLPIRILDILDHLIESSIR